MAEFREKTVRPFDVVFNLPTGHSDSNPQDPIVYPLFLFRALARVRNSAIVGQPEYQRIDHQGDLCDATAADRIRMVDFLRNNVPWGDFEPYVLEPPLIREIMRRAWENGQALAADTTIDLIEHQRPRILYRYLRFKEDWIERLLGKGELYLPSPSKFNDPLDCSYEEQYRLRFIECAVGCFSKDRDNVLMFSHYGDDHKGICVGFSSEKLSESLRPGGNAPANPLQKAFGDIRPVRYFKRMPPIDSENQPAFFATCKDSIWSYEKEYRLFVNRNSHLQPSGAYLIDREAIVEVVIGCRASDKATVAVKKSIRDLPECKCFKAHQTPNQFGIRIEEIERI